MDRRQPNNDSFRPALRFPADPHNPGVLPSKIQHIVAPASSSPSAANLLQSRRNPWEVDVSRLDDLVARFTRHPKVVVVLGDPPPSSLEPIVTSDCLRGSLVIIVVVADTNLAISSKNSVPAIRILRLQQPQHNILSHAESPDSHLPLSASRLNTALDWAERVASNWRASSPNGQATFALLHEEDSLPNASGAAGKPWIWKNKSKTKITTAPGAAGDVGGALTPWTARFAFNSRSNGSSLASGGSSMGSSIFLPETAVGPSVKTTASTSVLNHRTPSQDLQYPAPLRHKPASSRRPTMSAPPSSRTKQKGRLSVLFFPQKKSTVDATASSQTTLGKSASQPMFDAVINFLPSSSAAQGEASLGQGAIAATHASATHSRLLLRQTILVTTAMQRFLVPLAPQLSSSSRLTVDGEHGGRFGSTQRGRPLVPRINSPDVKTKYWSLTFVGALFSGDSPMSTKAMGKRPTLPTPPISRAPSSDEPSAPRPSELGPHKSTESSSSSTSHLPNMPPKLIHVLPFSVANSSQAVSAANARLVRSLEAFLLSWSFGGARADRSEEGSGASSSPNAVGTKRTMRPFLLDISGLSDVLRSSDPEMGSREWSLTDLILSGAMDDEYQCSGGSRLVTSLPSSLRAPPDVVITRASLDQRPSTAPVYSSSRLGESSQSDGAGRSDTSLGEQDFATEGWASRRAWLAGASDIMVYPNVNVNGPLAMAARSGFSSLGKEGTALGRVATKSLNNPVPAKSSPVVAQQPSPPRTHAHARSRSSSAADRSQSYTKGWTRVSRPEEGRLQPAAASSSDRENNERPRFPASSDDGHNSPSQRLQHEMPSAKRSSPEFSKLPSQQQQQEARPLATPTASAHAVARDPRPVCDGWAAPTRQHPSAVPQQHQSRQPPFLCDGADEEVGQRGQKRLQPSNSGWLDPARPAPSDRSNTVGTLTTINTMKSYSSTDSSEDFFPSYRSTSGRSPPAPSSFPARTPTYTSQTVPESMLKPPQVSRLFPLPRPTRGNTVPQPVGTYVRAPQPQYVPAPSPPQEQYARQGRRPSAEGEGYFNGYLVAPPPSSRPARPERMRPPPAMAAPIADMRARSTSSNLRLGVSADPFAKEPQSHLQPPRLINDGSVREKQLPITPPDSASSSEVSNEMDGIVGGGRRGEKRRNWWTDPAKVALRML